MVMNTSCKYEKASYNIFCLFEQTVKSLYTLQRRQCNKAKSIVSTGCYPVDTIIKEVYGLTVLYRQKYAEKRTILSYFSRPEVTLKTIAKVNKPDADTPSCTQPTKPFLIVSMQHSQH